MVLRTYSWYGPDKRPAVVFTGTGHLLRVKAGAGERAFLPISAYRESDYADCGPMIGGQLIKFTR